MYRGNGLISRTFLVIQNHSIYYQYRKSQKYLRKENEMVNDVNDVDLDVA